MSARYFYRWCEKRRESMADLRCLGLRGNKRCPKAPDGSVVDEKLSAVGNYCESCGKRLIALAEQRRSPHTCAG